ncbi:DNA cytosine methyltransferase [Streptomyces sp. DH12]|uniref:DNA cytosine methyltransferase n=1 Tax=Streptomyces sp. DH12 TaxID=2857010 RepID=UPI001E4EE227|nr:DNA cytosine methyltransferase [Streptomyces sp. DH12]
MHALFAGPGGLDHPAHTLGHPTLGIELDPHTVATRRNAGLPTINADVRHLTIHDLPEATTLTAGPPCQTYSVAGTGTGRTALTALLHRARAMAARRTLSPADGLDERSLLVLEPLRWILDAADEGRPYRAIVLEQVPQALPVWQTYAELLTTEGYSVACGILSAEQYGVPQTRRRAVLVANLYDVVALPAPTHRRWPPRPGDEHLLPTVAMADVLDRGEDFTVVSNYGTGGDPKARGRRHSSEPAFTVTGKVSRNRVLDADGRDLPRFTHAEAGALQGFPANYPWTGRDIPQQIGNACPVPLGAALIHAATTPAAVPA